MTLSLVLSLSFFDDTPHPPFHSFSTYSNNIIAYAGNYDDVYIYHTHIVNDNPLQGFCKLIEQYGFTTFIKHCNQKPHCNFELMLGNIGTLQPWWHGNIMSEFFFSLGRQWTEFCSICMLKNQCGYLIDTIYSEAEII